MQQMTISMLKPEADIVPYYQMFYRNYSLLVSTNIVTHHIVSEMPEERIFELICDVSRAAVTDYARVQSLYVGMGLGFQSPQIGEVRGLNLNELIELIRTKQISAMESLTTFINASEFLILFAIFEDAVKFMLIFDGIVSVERGLREVDVMKKIKDKLERKRVFPQFRDRLAARSAIHNFADAETTWKFFTDFRHLYVHSGGRATANWLEKFQRNQDELMNRLTKGTDLAKMFVADVIDDCQPKEGRLFIVTDKFTNIFRNFIVSIMEALYLTEPRKHSTNNVDSSKV